MELCLCAATMCILSHMTGVSPANSESLDPTDMPLRANPELRWCLHLNEPACVVGEHKQLFFLTLEDLLSPPIGEVGIEDNPRGDFGHRLRRSVALQHYQIEQRCNRNNKDNLQVLHKQLRTLREMGLPGYMLQTLSCKIVQPVYSFNGMRKRDSSHRI